MTERQTMGMEMELGDRTSMTSREKRERTGEGRNTKPLLHPITFQQLSHKKRSLTSQNKRHMFSVLIRDNSVFSGSHMKIQVSISRPRVAIVKAATVDSDYSARRSSSNEQRETIMLPGCDYNHWLIVMEFPKDPAPTREQMIDTYLNTLATVLGSHSHSYLSASVWV
ncbi:hypothetical protein DY000_02049658 [Brassica cretica]|uniref:MORF/ORRM1/DAG-like MORF domain-containing protein n=1 Tax=Brassica cretica TaxID=69181 RepID=A0ABQ7ENL6_BRACR|nr:hypothetical protein DY000_02049658 [Brassica cretica]